MAWLALALYVMGLALALGLTSLRQWRRTGDTGLRLDSGPVGSLRWWAKLLFVAALLLGLAGPLAATMGMDPLQSLDLTLLRGGGLALAILGVMATLLAQTNMGTSWRVGVDPAERTTLVTTGAFGLVRNPIFTAMGATSFGLAFMVPNAVSLAAVAALVIAVQVQVRAVEEPYLLRTHGDTYAAYAGRVGRFLPWLGTVQHGRSAVDAP